ITTIP
ncbi:hypothetical protein D029_3421B, partial [Vibrio parahaemolyticus 970107]